MFLRLTVEITNIYSLPGQQEKCRGYIYIKISIKIGMGNGEKLTHIKLMLGKEYCKQIDTSFAEFKEHM
jgi:hypothetical protein